MLEVKDIEVYYQNVIMGLQNVSLQVPQKGKIALLGANGAGKTTAIRAITGLLKFNGGSITKGQIIFQDKEITALTPQKIVDAGIVQVPEGRRVFTQLSAEENLLIGGSVRVRSHKERKRLIGKVFEYFPPVYERRKSAAGYLSGGEQQMLAIGRALMAKPILLIIDELSLGLAPLIVEKLAEQLLMVNEEDGTSILLVEQNARLALNFADYGYIIEDGQVVMEGTPEDLKQNTDIVEAYLG